MSVGEHWLLKPKCLEREGFVVELGVGGLGLATVFQAQQWHVESVTSRHFNWAQVSGCCGLCGACSGLHEVVDHQNSSTVWTLWDDRRRAADVNEDQYGVDP